jgi:hypothetical protein
MKRFNISAMIRIALLVSAVLVFGLGPALAGNTQSDGVLKAAKAGLPDWLNALPRDELHLYGFKSKSELAGAQLANPIEIVTLTPEDLRAGSARNTPPVKPRPTGEWYVPITVGGQFRALLSVTRTNGAWEVIGLSAAELAKELDQVTQEIPTASARQGQSGFAPPKLLRIYQARADLLYIPTDQEGFMVPLKSAQQALKVTRGEWLTLGNGTLRLHDAVDSALSNNPAQ